MRQPKLENIATIIIKGRLYLSGYRAAIDLAPIASLSVYCAKELPPVKRRGSKVVFLPMQDNPRWNWKADKVGVARILKASRVVADHVRRGKSVVVSCQAGVNRSGLVTALALCYLGLDPAKAIQVLRDKRSPQVLNNKSFAALVMEFGGRVKGKRKNDENGTEEAPQSDDGTPGLSGWTGPRRVARRRSHRPAGARRPAGRDQRPRRVLEKAAKGTHDDAARRHQAPSRGQDGGQSSSAQEAQGLDLNEDEGIDQLVNSLDSSPVVADLPDVDGLDALVDAADIDIDDDLGLPPLEVIDGGR